MVICTDKCLLCNSWISTKKHKTCTAPSLHWWVYSYGLLRECIPYRMMCFAWVKESANYTYAAQSSFELLLFLAWAGNKTGLNNPDQISIVLSLLPSQYFVDLLLNCWNNMEANSSLLLFIRWLACHKYIYGKLYVNKILQIVAWALGIDQTRRITN